MPRRRYHVPGAVTGAIAVVLLILATISMPLTSHKSSVFDIAKADRLNGNVIDVTAGTDNPTPLSAIKYGRWGYCTMPVNSGSYSECTNPLKYDYVQVLSSPDALQGNSGANVSTINKSWTRGLVTAAVALVVSVIAWILSFIPSVGMDVVASITYLIATLIAFVAFILDLVIFLKARSAVHYIDSSARVIPGAGFYLTLISIPFLFFSSLIVCIGAFRLHKEKKDEKLYSEKVGSEAAYA